MFSCLHPPSPLANDQQGQHQQEQIEADPAALGVVPAGYALGIRREIDQPVGNQLVVETVVATQVLYDRSGTLSACDTALGDERAALGLSGIAIRSGARSALATLWEVNDAAAARLVVEFYTQLQAPDVSRAQALQRAQQMLLAEAPYDHPGFWAAFLLISSWL